MGCSQGKPKVTLVVSFVAENKTTSEVFANDRQIHRSGTIYLHASQIPETLYESSTIIPCQVVNVCDGDTIRVRHTPQGLIGRNGLKQFPDGTQWYQRAKFETWRRRLRTETILIRLYGIDAPETAKPPQQAGGKQAGAGVNLSPHSGGAEDNGGGDSEGQLFAEEAKAFVIEAVMERVVYCKLLAKDQYGRALAVIMYSDDKAAPLTTRDDKVAAPVEGNTKATSRVATSEETGWVGCIKSALSRFAQILWKPKNEISDSKAAPNATANSGGIDVNIEDFEKPAILEVQDLSMELLKRGLASVYRGKCSQYDGKDEQFTETERIAKRSGIGIWSVPADKRELPEEFKRRRRSASPDKRRQTDRHRSTGTGRKRGARAASASPSPKAGRYFKNKGGDNFGANNNRFDFGMKTVVE